MIMHKSAEETLQEHIEVLGSNLGKVYSALYNEVAWLHIKWNEYQELYGTSPERINLLNSTAPLFFKIVQDTLFEEVLLSLTRLTDPPKSQGKGNLTIKIIPELLTEGSFRETLGLLILKAEQDADFARDWRNRHLAHRDVKIALGEEIKPLSLASRKKVGQAIKALADVLCAISQKYFNSKLVFDATQPYEGSISLLYIIRDGVNADLQMRERMRSGKYSQDDFAPKEPI
jgi:hypothetical protein